MGLRDIILPGEMKQILNQVIQAEKQAQANLIRRREESAAATWPSSAHKMGVGLCRRPAPFLVFAPPTMPPHHESHESDHAKAVDPGEPTHPIVLFDGECALCSASARFVVKRDPRAVFRFAALQSETGRRLLDEYGLSRDETDSIVLIDRGRARVRSGAALRVARRLRFPWPALAGLLVVPAPIRDCVYDFIAKRRYKWFGKVELCDVSDAMRERLVDDAEASSGANADASAHPA